MTPMAIALLLGLAAAALVASAVILLGQHHHREFRVVLPFALRCAYTLGDHCAPMVCQLIDRPFCKPVSAILQRDLRLAGLLPRIAVRDWSQVMVGVCILATAVSVLFQLFRGRLGITSGTLVGVLFSCAVSVTVTHQWLRGRLRAREASLLRELPAGLELLALSLECGCALPPALEIVGGHLPSGALRDLLQGLHGDLATGRSRSSALRRLFENNQGSVIAPTLGALVQAEAAGSSLAPVLRAQARQRTEERFAAAEKAALQAPVKMLLPLISCIFPCTFIVIAFPLVTRFLH